MITEATEEQWDEVERIRIRWLRDEQIEQHPVPLIREAVWKRLDAIGQKRVPVWVVDSPQMARVFSALFKRCDDNLHANHLRANLRDNLRDNLDANLDAAKM